MSKIVKKYFATLFDTLRAAPIFRPLLGGSDVQSRGWLEDSLARRKVHVVRVSNFQKNPRAHKNKIGTPPPPPKPPPKKEQFNGHGLFLQEERIFPGVHKIGAAISGPRIADTNFTDTGIFLKFEMLHRVLAKTPTRVPTAKIGNRCRSDAKSTPEHGKADSRVRSGGLCLMNPSLSPLCV